MQVQRIQSNNYNNPNFGAKLVFADKNAERLLHNTINYGKNLREDILNKFDLYMPEHKVEISIKRFRPIAQDWLFAKNLNTGYFSDKSLNAAERIYPMNYENGSDSLYALLRNILDKKLSWHNEFWGIKK